jgi:hypothetical protein
MQTDLVIALDAIVNHYDPTKDHLSFTECTQQINELKRLIAQTEQRIANRRPRPPAPTSGPYAPGQSTQMFHSQVREKRGY